MTDVEPSRVATMDNEKKPAKWPLEVGNGDRTILDILPSFISDSLSELPGAKIGNGDRAAILFFLASFSCEWTGAKVHKDGSAACRDSRGEIFPERPDISAVNQHSSTL
jgi:hypothetical protein